MDQNFQDFPDTAAVQATDTVSADPNQLLYYYKQYMNTYLDLVSAKETIATLNQELEQARDLTNSLSWKVTKPLRWLRDRIAR